MEYLFNGLWGLSKGFNLIDVLRLNGVERFLGFLHKRESL